MNKINFSYLKCNFKKVSFLFKNILTKMVDIRYYKFVQYSMRIYFKSYYNFFDLTIVNFFNLKTKSYKIKQGRLEHILCELRWK